MGSDKKTMCEDVARKVESFRDDLVNITCELMRIPSVNPPGDYERISQRMIVYYKVEGLSPVVARAPEEGVKGLGLTYPRPNIIARYEGRTHSPIFCLDAHMDVAGAGEHSEMTVRLPAPTGLRE